MYYTEDKDDFERITQKWSTDEDLGFAALKEENRTTFRLVSGKVVVPFCVETSKEVLGSIFQGEGRIVLDRNSLQAFCLGIDMAREAVEALKEAKNKKV